MTGALASTAVNAGGADGLFFGGTELFLTHLAALVIVAVFAFGGSFVLFKVVDKIMPLRVSEEQEARGLDLTQHSETVQIPLELVETGELVLVGPRKDGLSL